jgi:hypothetical protein
MAHADHAFARLAAGFPLWAYARWVERQDGMRVIEHRAMPPFGHFSLVRFAKSARVVTQRNDFLEAHAIG